MIDIRGVKYNVDFRAMIQVLRDTVWTSWLPCAPLVLADSCCLPSQSRADDPSKRRSMKRTSVAHVQLKGVAGVPLPKP